MLVGSSKTRPVDALVTIGHLVNDHSWSDFAKITMKLKHSLDIVVDKHLVKSSGRLGALSFEHMDVDRWEQKMVFFGALGIW